MIEKTAFRLGQRVQVVNLEADSTPAAYHGCTCRITGFTQTPEGQPAARVMFSGSVQKKIALSKLQPIEAPTVVYPAQRTERAAALPTWARSGCQWTLGQELQPGDTVYFSHIANPRQLVELLKPGHWKSTVIVDNYYRFVKRIHGQIAEVDANRWYVVKRVVR